MDFISNNSKCLNLKFVFAHMKCLSSRDYSFLPLWNSTQRQTVLKVDQLPVI